MEVGVRVTVLQGDLNQRNMGVCGEVCDRCECRGRPRIDKGILLCRWEEQAAVYFEVREHRLSKDFRVAIDNGIALPKRSQSVPHLWDGEADGSVVPDIDADAHDTTTIVPCDLIQPGRQHDLWVLLPFPNETHVRPQSPDNEGRRLDIRHDVGEGQDDAIP